MWFFNWKWTLKILKPLLSCSVTLLCIRTFHESHTNAGWSMLTRAKRDIFTNIPGDRMWSWFMFLTREPENKSWREREPPPRLKSFHSAQAKANPEPGEHRGSRNHSVWGEFVRWRKQMDWPQREGEDRANGDEHKDRKTESDIFQKWRVCRQSVGPCLSWWSLLFPFVFISVSEFYPFIATSIEEEDGERYFMADTVKDVKLWRFPLKISKNKKIWPTLKRILAIKISFWHMPIKVNTYIQSEFELGWYWISADTNINIWEFKNSLKIYCHIFVSINRKAAVFPQK